MISFIRKGKRREKEESRYVLKLLRETDFAVEKIAMLADVEVDFVRKIKQENT
jgi:hypothetical protein